MAKLTLPKDIETHLDNSLIFTKFGIVNIRFIKTTFKCELPDKELKTLINNRFSKEFVREKIEFI